mmetsp:Transcript_25047/g.28078  ORF Transcript_25047/g.28078 Transcript_25047/m.28078 type:complete len:85 (+) Transcript_25047:104-358(+)
MKHSYSHRSSQKNEFFTYQRLFRIILLFLGSNGGLRCCQALSSITMPPLTTIGDHTLLARKAMDYFDQSTDPFHAVKTSVDLVC